MTINNLQTIKSLLFFDNPGDVYVVQVMTRTKDSSISGSHRQRNRIVREYYVESVDYLDTKFDEIIKLCEVFNARAYINLNRKNKHALGPLILSILAEKMQHASPDYFNLISCALGKAKSDRRVFVVDVDNHDTLTVDKITRIIRDHALKVVPTPNGYHVLTTPFDTRMIERFDVAVHRNNPTILYANLVDSSALSA